MRKNYFFFIVLLVFSLFLFLISGCGSDVDGLTDFSSCKLYTTQYDGIIAENAAKNDLPVNLVRAVVQVESAGNKDALSPQGAMGLMQLMPETADLLGVKAPFCPEANIAGGTTYLKMMVDEFNDYELALAAYNAGPGEVRKYNGIPPYDETVNYVSLVMHLYRNSL